MKISKTILADLLCEASGDGGREEERVCDRGIRRGGHDGGHVGGCGGHQETLQQISSAPGNNAVKWWTVAYIDISLFLDKTLPDISSSLWELELLFDTSPDSWADPIKQILQ